MRKIGKKAVILLSIGLIATSSIGVGVYFIVRQAIENSNRKDTTNNISIKDSIDAFKNVEHNSVTISEFGGLELVEYKSSYRHSNGTSSEYLLNSQGLEILKNKIANRLGVGPEVAVLKGVFLRGDLGTFADGANGLYFGATNEIFINMNSIFSSYKAFRWNAPEEAIIDYEVLAEFIFQVIFHEYHHHIAEVYLKAYKPDDQKAQTIYKRSKANVPSNYSEKWDLEFLNTFEATLGYKDQSKTNLPDSYKYGEFTVKPLSNVLSLQDLFSRTNLISGPASFPEILNDNSIKYRPFSSNSVFSPRFNPMSEDDLIYYYDIDELFVRKMQQATMTIVHQGDFGYQNLETNTEEDATIGYFRSNFDSNTYIVSNFLFDTLNYANSVVDNNPFYKDYLFLRGTDSRPGNNNNAKTLYESLTKLMGYQSKDDISLLWWKNDAQINGKGQTILSGKTNLVKIGGYISNSDQNKRYYGYYDEENNFVGFPITVAPFSYRYKEKLNSTQNLNLDITKDNYFYLAEDFVDVTRIANRNLYLADDIAGLNAVKMTSTNSKASTYAASGSNSLNSQVAYPVVVNDSVQIKLN